MKSFFIQVFGLILVIYGFLAIVSSIFGFFYVAYFGLPTIGEPVNAEFQDMSKYMDDAANATTNAAVSIRNAKDALYSASASAKEASLLVSSGGDALNNISTLVGFEILGWQPFKESSSYFVESGNNFKSMASSLGELSSNMQSTAVSLESNAKDMELISGNFIEVSKKLDDVSEKLEPTSINFAAYIVLAFLLFHFILLYFMGVCLLKLNESKRWKK